MKSLNNEQLASITGGSIYRLVKATSKLVKKAWKNKKTVAASASGAASGYGAGRDSAKKAKEIASRGPR